MRNYVDLVRVDDMNISGDTEYVKTCDRNCFLHHCAISYTYVRDPVAMVSKPHTITWSNSLKMDGIYPAASVRRLAPMFPPNKK